MVLDHSFFQAMSSSLFALIPENFYERVKNKSMILKNSKSFVFCKDGIILEGEYVHIKADLVIFATVFKGDEKLQNIFESSSLQKIGTGSLENTVQLYRRRSLYKHLFLPHPARQRTFLLLLPPEAGREPRSLAGTYLSQPFQVQEPLGKKKWNTAWSNPYESPHKLPLTRSSLSLSPLGFLRSRQQPRMFKNAEQELLNRRASKELINCKLPTDDLIIVQEDQFKSEANRPEHCPEFKLSDPDRPAHRPEFVLADIYRPEVTKADQFKSEANRPEHRPEFKLSDPDLPAQSLEFMLADIYRPEVTKMDLQNTLMTIQLRKGTRIPLANAIIETGNYRAIIQFGSVDFLAITARVTNVSTYDINSKRPARRPHSTETDTRCAYLPAPEPIIEKYPPPNRNETKTLSARVYQVLKTVKEKGLKNKKSQKPLAIKASRTPLREHLSIMRWVPKKTHDNSQLGGRRLGESSRGSHRSLAPLKEEYNFDRSAFSLSLENPLLVKEVSLLNQELEIHWCHRLEIQVLEGRGEEDREREEDMEGEEDINIEEYMKEVIEEINDAINIEAIYMVRHTNANEEAYYDDGEDDDD
ncbi:putative flavin-containing monooxygenase 1 [Dendrobium catenatum]|uniref:Putative flavin-containing monooxygenase 1 n=1 Tax=Dendrobium catenatum TaxID=906689 RepID=A0A2I0WAU1_9ASPA|nr:putative flavin-containing monooxygenase 1 [Dendrobium catenatum]